MDPLHDFSGNPFPCHWCCIKNSEVIFENAILCRTCHEKALQAIQKPRLCKICSSLLTDESIMRELLSEDGYRHHNLSGLQRGSESGCGLCRLFLLQDPNPNIHRLVDELNLFAEGDSSQEKSATNIKSFYFASGDTYRLSLSVAALDAPATRFTSQIPVEANLGEDNTIKPIRGWLDECLSAHLESLLHHSERAAQSFPLPTRVIDIGTEYQPALKLFQPSSMIYEDYITLSYCWSKQPFLTTLNSNIQAHFDGLKESKLPQTFIDAIKITRKLGFRFLWIDALCIIQDSIEDKVVQIGVMESIYSNSILTIAVVSTTCALEGFLQTKSRLKVDIPYRSPGGTLGRIQISPQEIVDLWQEPLYTRAWCLQENLLSPRLLLLTNTEVIWQCQPSPTQRPNTTHVEYLWGDPKQGQSPFSRIPISISSRVSQESISSPNPELEITRYNIWRHIVQNYTRRNLTVLSDRLPAISAIAQKFKDSWGDEYLAGIWKRHFIASLTWRRWSSWQNSTPQYWPPLEQYRAPSWSWASIEGPVEFDHRLDLGNISVGGLDVKLISCEVIPRRAQAPLGELQGGRAVFEASLIPVQDIPSPGLHRLDPKMYWDGGRLVLDNHFVDQRKPGFMDKLDDKSKESAWAMLLSVRREGVGKMTMAKALILIPVDDQVDTFQRVGFWSGSSKRLVKLWAGARNRKTITII